MATHGGRLVTVAVLSLLLISSQSEGVRVHFTGPVPGSLVPVGDMSSARAAHTATALPDGRVLIAGGLTGAAELADAELYDRDAGGYSPTRGMRTRRQSHTATLLSDGRVLITGGYDSRGNYLASVEVYEPEGDSFTSLGPMATARAGHVAVPLEGGSVLLVGGVGTGWTFLESAEIYDPAAGSSAWTGPMSRPRESHAAVRLDDGRVLVIGGHSGRGAGIELYPDSEVYDPVTGTFSPGPTMTVRRHKHDAVVVRGGAVLVTGGADERDESGQYASAELLDVVDGAATPVGPMNRARYKHAGTSVVMTDGRVLLAGGAPRAEVYDPASRSFELVASGAEMAGQFAASALLPEGQVLITGGYGRGQGPQSRAWIYTPAEGR